MGGPLSAQEWSYLAGRDFGSATIYASFRMTDNKFDLYPQPPPVGLSIHFQYISRNWVTQQGTGLRADNVVAGSDVVMYEPIMIIKFLKAKFLESKGFDATAARIEFENMFGSRTGKDTGAPILSASHSRGFYPYIRPYANTPDTGYG
jgi:hypothetical protein